MLKRYLMTFHIICMQMGQAANVVSSATYYQVPYPFNFKKLKSKSDVAVEEK